VKHIIRYPSVYLLIISSCSAPVQLFCLTTTALILCIGVGRT